jgi:hypothetical protein
VVESGMVPWAGWLDHTAGIGSTVGLNIGALGSQVTNHFAPVMALVVL